jgi:Ser/Thr protein kinase RdoA (MazF antagonist)
VTDEARALPAAEVSALLAHFAGVGAVKSVRSAGGTAGRHDIVDTTTDRYSLRRRNPRYTAEEAVAFDHCLMEHLAAHGVPVVLACELRGMAGRRWLRRGPHEVVELYPWREGQPFDQHSVGQLAAAGQALGQFHAATRGFTGAAGKQWPRYDRPEAILEGLHQASELAETDEQRALLSYLREQARLLAAALPDRRYPVLPHTVIHGDYHTANLLFTGDAVAGIFDLDWATYQPRLRDLADGILFFAALRASPIEGRDIASLTQTPWLDAERAGLFLASYQVTAGWPLEADETEALAEFVRARWLFCRVDGLRKVPRERWLRFLLDGVAAPLHWLAAHPHALAPTGTAPA